MMSRVSDKVLQMHGGWGYTKDFPIEQFYRDSRMYRIVEGPNEVHRMVVARRLLSGGIDALERPGRAPVMAAAMNGSNDPTSSW